MKENIKFITISFFISLLVCCSTSKGSNSYKSVKKEATEKVARMQKLINFNNEKAFKLEKIELNFLKKLYEVKNCNKEKFVQDLKRIRDMQLKNTLNRNEYIKYNAIENNRIKNIELIAK